MDHSRSKKRRHLIYYLKVFDDTNNELLGHMADINVDGILIMSENKLAVNQNISLKIEFPEEIQEMNYFKIKALSKWCRVDVNPDLYITGFQFIDQTIESTEIINNLVSLIGFND